jgi:predicted PurR-regulated permease PerM
MTSQRPTLSIPELTTRQLVMATLVVGLVVLAFWIVFQFHQAFLILLAGIIVSVALKPVITRLQRLGIPPWAGMLIFYALLALLAVLFLIFGVPLISQQVTMITDELNRGYMAIRDGLLTMPNLIIKRLAESLPTELAVPGGTPVVPAMEGESPTDPGAALRQVLSAVGLAANALFQIAAIFLLAFFWTLESERIKRSGLLVLGRNHRDSAREMIEAMESRVSTYVSGQLLLAGIIGGLALVAYLIIGLPNALALGLFMSIMELIPVIGPIIGAVPAILIAFSVSPSMALWVVLALVVIHQLEANIIGPRVMRRAMDIRPLVTLLALAAFGSLFGILGALVALPLASILQLFLDRYVLDISAPDGVLADRSKTSLIRYEINNLIEDTRKLIRRQESESVESGEQIEDLIEALAVDLDSLLAQTTEEAEAL